MINTDEMLVFDKLSAKILYMQKPWCLFFAIWDTVLKEWAGHRRKTINCNNGASEGRIPSMCGSAGPPQINILVVYCFLFSLYPKENT